MMGKACGGDSVCGMRSAFNVYTGSRWMEAASVSQHCRQKPARTCHGVAHIEEALRTGGHQLVRRNALHSGGAWVRSCRWGRTERQQAACAAVQFNCLHW